MPHTKKKANKTGGGRSKGIPKQAANKSFVCASDDSSPAGDFEFTRFSLRDAARNSERPSSYWSNSRTSLRHQAMKFIPSSRTALSHDMRSPVEPITDSSPDRNPHDQPSIHTEATYQSNFPAWESRVSERTSQLQLATPESSNAPPISSSTSSGDEVVFIGRRSRVQILERRTPIVHQSAQDTQTAPQQNSKGRASQRTTIEFDDFIAFESSDNNMRSRAVADSRQAKPPRPQRLPVRSAAIEAALDDYASNMKGNGEIEDMNVQAGDSSDMNGWGTSDLQDFDDLATSLTVLETVAQVLSKRERPSGLQYLIVWEGQTTDDARWTAHTSLPATAASLILSFEEAEKAIPKYPLNSDSDDTNSEDTDSEDDELDWGTEEDEDAEDLDEETIDDMADELDLEIRHRERLSDEAFARLLQKQEFLGIHAEDLELFDGIEDVEVLNVDPRPRASSSYHRKPQTRRRGRIDPSLFEDNELMLEGEGDNYGDFDIMDRERPSLNFFNPIKGKNSATVGLHFDLSDSDLANNLQAAWSTDRKTKAAKKREREELRAQGLLGKKHCVQNPNLNARYNNAISFDQLESELEKFLANPTTSQLSLPPMEKRDRKIMHDVANSCGLKSKSQGAGKTRFTILFKTSKTLSYAHDSDYERLRTRLRRKVFPRMDMKGKGRANAGRPKRGGGFGAKADVSYREGEAVGGTAPEIGVDNRGRAMLEKMGWSTGTALGALGSQGILTPIAHIVRNSRAGLG